MLVLLSPAKTLDYSPYKISAEDAPQLRKKTSELIKILKSKSANDISTLMHVKEKLAQLNYERYQNFSSRYTDKNSKAALFAFNGDVYTGMDAQSLTKSEIKRAQESVRILSGLYGLLRPLDKMQPYRLEMGTKLKNYNGSNLYHFWGDDITKLLNKDLKKQNTKLIVNLASKEYFSVVNKNLLDGEILDIGFKEYRNGKLTFISFNAKKARGLMTRYILKCNAKYKEDLKGFNYEDYGYDEELSSDNNYMFVR